MLYLSISLYNFKFLFNSAICFESYRPKHNTDIHLSYPFLIPYNFDTPASQHVIPLISFLVQHSLHGLASQMKAMPPFTVNKLFSDIFAATFL